MRRRHYHRLPAPARCVIYALSALIVLAVQAAIAVEAGKALI